MCLLGSHHQVIQCQRQSSIAFSIALVGLQKEIDQYDAPNNEGRCVTADWVLLEVMGVVCSLQTRYRLFKLKKCDNCLFVTRQALELQHVQSPSMLLDSREQTKDLTLMVVDTCEAAATTTHITTLHGS